MNVPQTFEDLVAFAHAMVAVGRCSAGYAARVVLDDIAERTGYDYSVNLWRALDVAMDREYYRDWSADLRTTIRKAREEYEAWVLSQQTG